MVEVGSPKTENPRVPILSSLSVDISAVTVVENHRESGEIP